MKRALLVYAHCDDELIWGHPFLLDRSLDRRVLICSSDKTNPDRQSYRLGEEALEAVCRDVGVSDFRVLPFQSEFYRLRTRGLGNGPLLMQWWETAQAAISDMMRCCDFIATHNPIGEYGHMDHVLVRRAVLEMDYRPTVRWTNARVTTTTWPVSRFGLFGRSSYRICEQPPPTDAEEFDRLKSHYVSRGCYTWSSEEPLVVTAMEEDVHS